jgi:hypothetical protein
MKRITPLVLLAALMLGGCAEISSEISSNEPRELRLGASAGGSGTLIGWASACPACGADMGGGGGFMSSYLYDGTQKARGPGQEW